MENILVRGNANISVIIFNTNARLVLDCKNVDINYIA